MSERAQRYLLWLLAVCLVGGTAVALRLARDRGNHLGFGLSTPSPLMGDIALRFNHVRVVGRRDNKRAWTVNAGRIESTRSRTRLDFAGGVEATLLDNEKPRATVTAPQATFDATARVLVAAGNLVGRVYPANRHGAGDDLVIEAGQAIWNVGSHTLTCPGAVHAHLPNLDLRGTDFTVDLQTREHSLKRFEAEITLTGGDEASQIDPTGRFLKGITP